MIEHKVTVWMNKNAYFFYIKNESFINEIDEACGDIDWEIDDYVSVSDNEDGDDYTIAIIVDSIDYPETASDINIKLIQAVSRYEDMYNDKRQLLMILEQFEASLLQIREYSSNDWVHVQGHNEYNITTKMMEIKNIMKQLDEYNVR